MNYIELKESVIKILKEKISNEEKRKKLNELEKNNSQDVFIKTYLCECGKMKVEFWYKAMEDTLVKK